MGKGDISQLSFGEICALCKHISRGIARTGKNPRDLVMSQISKYATGIVSAEIRNLFDNFKTYVIGSLIEKLDTLNIKNKKKDENATLSILCPRENALKECPLIV